MSTLNIERAALLAVIQVLLQRTDITLLAWHVQPLRGGTGENVGLWRVTGQADQQGQTVPWSLVLKLLRPQQSNAAVGNWNYWRREADVYTI